MLFILKAVFFLTPLYFSSLCFSPCSECALLICQQVTCSGESNKQVSGLCNGEIAFHHFEVLDSFINSAVNYIFL